MSLDSLLNEKKFVIQWIINKSLHWIRIFVFFQIWEINLYNGEVIGFDEDWDSGKSLTIIWLIIRIFN
jgi:hypothetical protein